MSPRAAWRARALLLAGIFAACACWSSPYRGVPIDPDAGPAADVSHATLRFSVAAMMSPRETYAAYSRLFARVGKLLGVDVELVQRRTYREVNDRLRTGRLDVALLCSGGYVDLAEHWPGAVEILAVPEVEGKTTYESLVIVPATSTATTLADLAGKRFAFTDELSFTGHLYPTVAFYERGLAPAAFLGMTYFTHSHDRSVRAVADGFVDAAAVDSLVYASVAEAHPEISCKTRVIERSPPFEMGPLVASRRVPAELRAKLREVLLGLANDPAAAKELGVIRVGRFVPGDPARYAPVVRIAHRALGG